MKGITLYLRDIYKQINMSGFVTMKCIYDNDEFRRQRRFVRIPFHPNTVNSLVSDHPWGTTKWSLTRGGRLRERSTK